MTEIPQQQGQASERVPIHIWADFPPVNRLFSEKEARGSLRCNLILPSFNKDGGKTAKRADQLSSPIGILRTSVVIRYG